MTPPQLTRGLVVVLGFLSAVGPFAIDMYLASLPQIADELEAAPATVQLTLTAFLLGLGVGQLLLGPLSDMWGRRRVLLLATTAFTLTSVALIASPNIEVFIGLRLLQGLSGAAGVVIARAIAVDLSTGRTAVRALSLIATVGGLGPLVAPPIGGLVASFSGWRGVLTALARATASNRGAGAALMGACQFAVGALVTPVVGLWGEETALPMACVMLLGAVISLTLGLASNRASGRTHPA